MNSNHIQRQIRRSDLENLQLAQANSVHAPSQVPDNHLMGDMIMNVNGQYNIQSNSTLPIQPHSSQPGLKLTEPAKHETGNRTMEIPLGLDLRNVSELQDSAD